MTDLAQPKKAPSAYFIWLNENREKIQKDLGTKDVGQVGKKAGAMWSEMAADAKKPFEEKAKEAKAQYEKDLAAFKAAGGAVGKRKSKKDKADKKKKKLAEKDKPKKPAGGGYGVYLGKHRAAIEKEVPEGTSKLTGVTKIAGERWKNLSDADKKPYEDEYAEKKKKYEEALEEWKKNRPAEEPSDDDKDGEPAAKKPRVAKEKKEKEPKPEKPAKAAGGRGRGRGRGGRGGGAAKSAAEEAAIDPAILKDAEKADMAP